MTIGPVGFPYMSFIERLKAAKSVGFSDPWQCQLKAARGNVGLDGVERLSTNAVFDFLDLPAFKRTPEAAKRVRLIMTCLGWIPVRARHLTSNGHRSRVRGYARTAARSSINEGG